ncbi:MAG: hypothetical protein II531_05520 [Bacteroidales bacterium]|nr:hypothetical protein [Bacteroidales bacterium]
MFDFETSVAGIEFKVRQLSDEVRRLRRQLEEKEDQCIALQEAQRMNETLINKLKEENKIIKLGNRLTERGDSTEMKLKINQMIRTIDKSIELLKNV